MTDNRVVEISTSLHTSSQLRKIFAYLFSLVFLLMGLLTFPSNWLVGLGITFIGCIHLFLLFKYVSDIEVLPSFIRISALRKKEEVPWQEIKCIDRITYCTRHLWRIRFNQPRRSVFFFSTGKGMNDFLKTKVKLTTYP